MSRHEVSGERSASAVVVFSVADKIVGWDSGAERLFGYPAREALGCAPELVFPGWTYQHGQADSWAADSTVVSVGVTKGGRALRVVRRRTVMRDADARALAACEVIAVAAGQSPADVPQAYSCEPATSEHYLEPVRNDPTRASSTALDRRAQEAVRDSLSAASERHFRQLVEALPQLAWTCAVDGECEFLSRRWLEFTGVDEVEQRGFAWLHQVHPDDSPRMLASWADAVRAHLDELALELRIRRHDGVYRWFDTRVLLIRDESGEPTRWVGSSTDVHEARELRERLRIEQERLEGIIASSPGVVVLSWRNEPDGRRPFDFISSTALDVYGYTPEQLAVDPEAPWRHIVEEDLAGVLAELKTALDTGGPSYCEYRYRHPTKGIRWHETRSPGMRREGSSLVWSAVVIDVTERKLTSEKLKLVQGQLEGALDAADMGAWIWDAEDDKLWATPRQRCMWELPVDAPEWLDGRVLMEQIVDADRERIDAEVAHAFLTGEPLKTEYRLRTTDGGIRWIAGSYRAERSPDGRPRRLAGINRDITQQKQAAEATLRSQKLEALGTLAGGIAHDFNNALYAITGNTAVAQTLVPRDSRVRALLDDIEGAGVRAADLVRQVLAFSQPEQQKCEPIVLPALVAEALRLVRATLPAMVEISSDFATDVPSVFAERPRLVQALLNLCTNAAHAIGKGKAGRIEVVVRSVVVGDASEAIPLRVAPGTYVMLSVRDDGAGMDDATRARIFDPFFTTKAPGEGSGLGLSVVHGIVKALDGAIVVDSQIGRGTTFRLYFPAMAVPPPRSHSVRVETPPGAGKRIMLVDDEEMLVTLGESFLELLGYEPAGFQHATAALAAFREDPDAFSALITDLSMPTLSGFELARAVLAIRKDLPILMISGFLGPDERATAARIGIRQVLLKPVSLAQLGPVLGDLCAGRALVSMLHLPA